MTGTRPIVVHPAAAAMRRQVGAQAWSALEVLAAATDASDPDVVVMSVRSLALELGVSTNTAARALAVLCAAGLVASRQERSSNGRFSTGSYKLTIAEQIITVDASTAPTEPTSVLSSARVRSDSRRRHSPPAQLSLLDAS